MSDFHIRVKDVVLDYRVYDYRTLSIKNTLVSLASAGKIASQHDGILKVRALDGMSFELKRGDRLGLIGGNGSGKTSLLKLLAGIYEPTSGTVEIEGKVTTLLGTGFGLDDEASGYENILLGGIALGFSLKDMQEKVVSIADFTELGQFLNMPLRTYSAGMRARLAFAIATCREPDILVIDEGIGAGDNSFYEKANRKMQSFLEAASILVMASHSEELLKTFCTTCLCLNSGQVVFHGPLDEGLSYYHNHPAVSLCEGNIA